MDRGRSERVKKSVITTLLLQIITLICGLIVPRLLLGAYGSEAYGATTSISQFLSYITLLEGGIGGVARAALYKPLAEGDKKRVSIIVNELKCFFRIIAYISIAYAVVLACTFKFISHMECYDWMTTFLLVLAMAISTFGQYFIGISYSALIQADQRVYIVNILSIATTIINTVMTIMLVYIGSGLVFVKLVSSIVFLLKPTAMWLYVKRRYGLIETNERDKDALSQRWTGLGQHIAYYIHSNTDVAVLTLLDSLKAVSVYSVYHMVTNNIQNIVFAFCSGMEPLFGDMIARKEQDQLNQAFTFYENMTSFVCCILFSTVYAMIVPFIKIYTRGIEDVNYFQPVFAYLITTASLIFCLRFPYQHTISAAGHFKKTRWAAYGEALININISIVLVRIFGIVGVAMGTIAAIGFRLCYSVVYLSKNITQRPISLFMKRIFVNLLNICIIMTFEYLVLRNIIIETYLLWIGYAAVLFAISVGLTICINVIFYKDSTLDIMRLVKKKMTRK